MRLAVSAVVAAVLVGTANAHQGAWHDGMYCKDGPSGRVDQNTNNVVNPLYDLPFSEWWMHHVDKCDEFPPPPGEFLDLPAGGSFTVQIATNRAFTTFSYNGQFVSDWPDGKTYPDDYNVPTCIVEPNLHAQNETMAAGTAFAISYESELSKVTPENLAVFTVRYHTPFKRLTTYDVPAAMPACPEGGCICAWGWVPNGCGQPNMYMQPFRCRVTGATSTNPIAPPQPAVWCEDDPSRCVQGSKQMIYWNQRERNNIEVRGYDLSGSPRSPAYNAKLGFADGAQNDIFQAPPPSNNAGANPSPGSESGSGNNNNNNSGSCAPPPPPPRKRSAFSKKHRRTSHNHK